MYFGVGWWVLVFWQPFFLFSISMVFHDFPILTIAAFVWAGIGQWGLKYSGEPLREALILTLALVVNAGLHFAIDAFLTYSGRL